MMMDTAVQQQTDPNGQGLITPNERQSLIQKLNLRWPLDLSTRIENQAFEKSKGIKALYFRFVQGYYQQVQNVIQNRTNQQRPTNPNATFPNSQTNLPQQSPAPIVGQPQHQLTHMPTQSSHYSAIQQQPRMMNPQHNQMTRLREPQKFNSSPINTISYPTSPTTTITTIDLSQSHSSQQMNIMNSNDYPALQPRYPIQPSRQRPINPNGNIQQQQQSSSSNNTNDILQQYVVGNSLTMPILSSSATTPINSNNSSTGDQVLHRMLLSNHDGGSNKIQNRQSTSSVMSQLTRSASTMNSNTNNSTHPLRSSLSSQQLSPSPSVVIMPTPAQTSTVQIQPSNNIIIQQSPLNNSNGPYSANSQTVSMNISTPLSNNYSSPISRTLSSSGSGHISSPDDEIINLIKYLKENVNRLQPLLQKFTNEGNNEKVRQVHSVHQQIIQFINNPTYETVTTAKHCRDMLDRIPNRAQLTNVPPAATTTTESARTNPPPPPTNIFNQCSKTTVEFLLRDQKDRTLVMKRYLEPLSDVINGVPHKMMRLDVDNCSTRKIPSYNQSSLLSILTDELNQLPADVFSIERISVSRSMKTNDSNDEYLSKTGIVLRCKLLEKCNPIIPPLRLHLTTRYPEQSPDILSLTKAMPPRLEFSDGHPFFDQISSVFVSHLFKLRPQHTITDILNIWRQSVQAAL